MRGLHRGARAELAAAERGRSASPEQLDRRRRLGTLFAALALTAGGLGLARVVDASDGLAKIAPHASRVVVLHGHRHRDWAGVRGDLVVCSAPSVSPGTDAASDYRGSFNIHELAFAAGGEVRMTATERVSV